ncbi:MFS transporter [Halobaculum gomorrense]|uniref:Predicted arabinose efflux permease, MFS family n=1 Tax=Halobaculum gomorrense TaxID=43928 RepID=A0A1M5K503_9EURY|nr:MFS transporter [Halobaculum gomorrense]SHG47781.1 Predicted arabinose efflux permease, MFS family [Halobaculum gomorrense]
MTGRDAAGASSVDSGRRRLALAAISGGNFSQFGARILLGAVVPFILLEFDTTEATLGLALTGMWATYALAQFPSGVLADRLGERPLVLAGIVGAAVGTALVAVSPTVLVFGAATVVLGAGAGLFFAPATALLSRLYDERGGALSVLTGAGAVAGAAFPAAGGVIAERFGWEVAVGAGVAVAVPAVAATLLFVPAVPPANPERDLSALVDPARIRGILARPPLAYTTALAVLCGFTFQAVSSFLAAFLVAHRGLAPSTAATAFGAVFGISAVAQPANGRVSDALSRDAAVASSVTLAGVGIATLVLMPGLAGTVVGVAVLGAGISWPGPIQARFMDRLTDAERGYGFGLLRTVYMFLAASGSVVTGVVASAAGWPAAYGLVIALLATCLGLLGANRVLGLGL